MNLPRLVRRSGKKLLRHKWYQSGCSCGPVHNPDTQKSERKGRLVKKGRKNPTHHIRTTSWKVKMRHQPCHYCGHEGGTIDHVVPQSKGGQTVPENCVPACSPCNNFRGDKPYGMFKKIGWMKRMFAE